MPPKKLWSCAFVALWHLKTFHQPIECFYIYNSIVSFTGFTEILFKVVLYISSVVERDVHEVLTKSTIHQRLNVRFENKARLQPVCAVNLIVAWWLFACSMKCVICFLPLSWREKMSFIYLFQQIGFIVLFFNSSVSTFAVKMFAKATATFVPITDTKVKASQTLKLEQPWTSLSF